MPLFLYADKSESQGTYDLAERLYPSELEKAEDFIKNSIWHI